MFRMQPHEKNIVLTCTDAQKMTPLHCAAMFDYPEVTEYLIKEGALSSELRNVKTSQMHSLNYLNFFFKINSF